MASNHFLIECYAYDSLRPRVRRWDDPPSKAANMSDLTNTCSSYHVDIQWIVFVGKTYTFEQSFLGNPTF